MSRSFKGPKTFKPELAEDVDNLSSSSNRRSSRHDIWKEELGFEEEEHQSSENDDGGMRPSSSKLNDSPTPTDTGGITYDSIAKEYKRKYHEEKRRREADKIKREQALANAEAAEARERKATEELAKATATYKSRISMMQATHKTALDDKAAEIADLNDQLDQASQQVVSLQNRLRDLLTAGGGHISDIDQRLLSGASDVVSKDVVDRLAAELESSRTENEELRSQMETLTAVNAAGLPEATQALRATTLLSPRSTPRDGPGMDELRKSLAEAETANAEFSQRLAELQSDNEVLAQKLRDAISENQTMSPAATPSPRPEGEANGVGDMSVAEELAAVKDELEKTRVKYGTVKQQFKALATIKDDLERTAREKLAEYKAKVKAAEAAAASASAEGAPASKEMQERLAAAEKKTEELEAEKKNLEAAKAKLKEKVETAKQLLKDQEEEMDRVMHKYNSKVTKMKATDADRAAQIGKLYTDCKALKAGLEAVKQEAAGLKAGVEGTVGKVQRKLVNAIDETVAGSAEIAALYRKEVAQRRKLYNELQELKGNIRVYCRVRPLLSDKEKRDGMSATFPSEFEVAIRDGNKRKLFEFDQVYGPTSSQEKIFADTQPLVASVVDGYNVCIFAYGQTGSGKTHTMAGPSEDEGVNFRALSELFAILDQRGADYEYEINVCLMEIYCEKLQDLLVEPSDSRPKLEIKQGKKGMEVPGITEVRVTSVNDVKKVMATGHKNRAVAETKCNTDSSRSHAIVRVSVTCRNKVSKVTTTGKLTLVDLAGSERVGKSEAKGQVLAEAKAINRSLTCLGDVIAALSKKESHIPFRNSKLTYLLSDSLGGDSKTLMFVCVNPAVPSAGETICSLLFAQRVKTVELGKASRSVQDADAAGLRERIRELESEVAALKT